MKEKIAILPLEPGCYLMKNSNNQIIYVGKAKNLKNRIKSYFTGRVTGKTKRLVEEIVDFEYIITPSELDALILEIHLIKKHLPKYNIRLVDDKMYPYILLTNDQHPRLIVVREAKSKKGQYFGPYPNVSAARKTTKILNFLFPLRKCEHIPKKSCLYYHLHQCLGPCIKDIDYDYQKEKGSIVRFLKGDGKEIIGLVQGKMFEFSEKQEYEKALEYRNIRDDLQRTVEKQKMATNFLTPIDFIGVHICESELSIVILHMRYGAITQNYKTVISYIDEGSLSNFLAQFYEMESIRPREICISAEYIDATVEAFTRIKFRTPSRGAKKELLDIANFNAKENLETANLLYQNKALKRQTTIDELGEMLGINSLGRIEAFDNSNLFGEYPVSAMVCFINGQKAPKEYRKYIIKTVVGANDYQTMKEVVYRRYFRLLSEDKEMPDLIVIDGGTVLAQAATDTLNTLGLSIPVVGLRKDSNHQTDALVYKGEEIPLKKNSDVFIFLANIQKTVHDYAISFFRNRKVKGFFSSKLDGIPQLGKIKKEKLLKEFVSIERIKNLSMDEFKSVGINERLACSIIAHLKEQ